MALLITLCAPCAAAWIEIVHGSFQLWTMIVECGRRHGSKQEVKTAKWKRRHRKGPVARLEVSLGRLLNTATTYLDRLVTWAVGNEPTTKERLTWTAAGFRNQRRVRKGLSSGQGYYWVWRNDSKSVDSTNLYQYGKRGNARAESYTERL